ncbi:MAG: aldose 1-epimerase family protein [Chthoniobacteraceae bacterium]
MKALPLLVTLTACSAAAIAAEPFRKILISARDNVRVDEATITSKDVASSKSGWSVKKSTLHGGRQEGVELIVVDNGVLQFTVIPTRGMGVLSVTMGDVRLGWESPVKEVVHPRHINLQSRGGLGWLEGFNEWMVRCGLESNGHPGTDKFINNVGDEATMDLTLHGKIGNIPASEVEVLVDRDPPHRIRIRGRVDERMFYGPKLELQTEISTEPGANTFRIADTITNRGAEAQEFEIIYHANYGRPLLEEGSTFLAPVASVTPFNDHAAKDVENYARYAGPTAGFIEQVYCIRPLADKDGRTLLALQNKARDRAVSMSFSVKELPFVSLWKNTNAVGEGYVTGLEPGTNFPNNRRIERKLGRVPKLAPGASHSATIDFAIYNSADETKRLAGRVAAIQGDAKPVLEQQPEKKE